jgi:hypothetical protein
MVRTGKHLKLKKLKWGIKQQAGENRPVSFFRVQSGLFALYVAISAVYRLVAARLEGYLSFFAALSTNSGEHLARSASAHTAATAATITITL